MCQGQIFTDPKHICFKFIPRVDNIFSTLGDFFTKDRIVLKIKQLLTKSNSFRFAETKWSLWAKWSLLFNDMCNKTWKRSLATQSLKSGKENNLGAIKAEKTTKLKKWYFQNISEFWYFARIYMKSHIYKRQVQDPYQHLRSKYLWQYWR